MHFVYCLVLIFSMIFFFHPDPVCNPVYSALDVMKAQLIKAIICLHLGLAGKK